jgi:hypothetical protein
MNLTLGVIAFFIVVALLVTALMYMDRHFKNSVHEREARKVVGSVPVARPGGRVEYPHIEQTTELFNLAWEKRESLALPLPPEKIGLLMTGRQHTVQIIDRNWLEVLGHGHHATVWFIDHMERRTFLFRTGLTMTLVHSEDMDNGRTWVYAYTNKGNSIEGYDLGQRLLYLMSNPNNRFKKAHS